MCQLCSEDPNERISARQRAWSFAERLEKIAQLSRGLASGNVKPHSEFNIKPVVHSVIRELVSEWM